MKQNAHEDTQIEDDEITFEFKEFFDFLIKRWKLVAVGTIACMLIAFIYLFLIATPIYEATAQIYVVNSGDSLVNLSDLQIGTYLTSDYQLVFDTWEVNQEVIERLGLSCTAKDLRKMLTVKNPGNTRALFVTVESPNAREAMNIANEYANVARRYIAETMRSDEPTMLSTALEPLEPIRPEKGKGLILAFLLGLLLNIGALLAYFMLNDKIKTGADLQRYTGSMPLAIIPVFEKKKGRR